MDEELEKLKEELRIYKNLGEILEVNPNCSYIIQPEVGNMPKEQVAKFCQRLHEFLIDKFEPGSFVIIPTHDGIGKIEVTKLENEVISYDQD